MGEQSGPLVWCHVCHWIAEVLPCEALEAKCNPNNKTTPGVGNSSPCGCSCRQSSMSMYPPPTNTTTTTPLPLLSLSLTLPGPHSEWHPGQYSLAARGIKTNIFSLKSDLEWEDGIRRDSPDKRGRMMHSWLLWAAVSLLEALIRLFWHQTLV